MSLIYIDGKQSVTRYSKSSYAHTHKYTHTRAHTHTRTHTHTHTHTHTFFLFSLGKMPNCTVRGRLYLHHRGLVRHMQMHNQEQPASTCGQCEKTFNRPDKLSKHLRHCTCHRPPPPQLPQQQQHTIAPPQGDAVERYNIDMQEKQHLDHLSPALHLLLPTMKTFQAKHCAYKFQVAIPIVYHKVVDPSVVTQPPVTLTSEMIAVYAADAAPPLDDVNRQLLNFIDVFELNGSGWVFSHFQDPQLTLWQLDPLRGSAYMPLPRWIQTRRAVVNVAGTGDDCFKWAILAGMHSVETNARRRVKYAEHMGKYDFSSLYFPAPLQAVGPFALRNNMSINVNGVDDLIHTRT